jgi:hypothetical protein
MKALKLTKNILKITFLYIVGMIDRLTLVPFPFLKSPSFAEIFEADKAQRLYTTLRVIIGIIALLLLF